MGIKMRNILILSTAVLVLSACGGQSSSLPYTNAEATDGYYYATPKISIVSRPDGAVDRRITSGAKEQVILSKCTPGAEIALIEDADSVDATDVHTCTGTLDYIDGGETKPIKLVLFRSGGEVKAETRR